jgi:catechol 2,3-dioxygenase
VINENALRISPRRASGSAIVFGSIVIFFILTYAKPYYLLKSILDDTCLPPARAKLKKSKMLNTETVIHPKLQHLGLTTGNLQPLLAWYKTVLGMRLIYLSENPIGAPADSTPSIKAVWLSNDEANHRIAVVEISGLVADPERPRHQRLQHVAFAYSTLDDLLGTYVRLKALGILPAISVDEGSQIAFYYEDPDRNSVELNVSNYAETWASIEHIQNSPEFARRPLGVDVDPEKLVAAYETGASAWELHKRAWKGDFAPAQPYDPKVLL